MAIYVRDEKGVLQALDIPAYKGEKGEAGITPNLQVGDVVTLESGQQATIVRRGDDENPIFDFAIPKGDDGKDGIFVGRVDDAPDHAQVVVNDDASPYDLFFENANVSYMGDTYTSLKEKADADIEYLLREIQTQHYEGSNITATDTYQKQVRSAILKGNTLVNLLSVSNVVVNKESFVKIINLNQTPKIGDKCLIKIKINSVFESTNGIPIKITLWNEDTSNGYILINSDEFKVGFEKSFLSTVIDGDYFQKSRIKIWGRDVVNGEANIDIIIIPYQDDMENWNIPYFEGMQSVKLPVLMTIGKNLNSANNEDVKPYAINDNGSIATGGGDLHCEKFIKVPPSSKIFLSFGENPYIKVLGYDENKNLTRKIIRSDKSFSFQTNADEQYIRLSWNPKDTSDITKLSLSLSDYEYEPYKSNILSTPEDLELRGIGNVQDTLDLMTGEKVERIDEIVLDGSENWTLGNQGDGNSTITFQCPCLNAKTSVPIISDLFNYNQNSTNGAEGIAIGLNVVFIQIKRDRLSSMDANGFKQYLSQNPVTVQYELATPIIKTVDLNGQKVYSYDGTTHYTTSSGVEGHPAPILSIDVPTNLPALVSQQRDTIQALSAENEALKEEVAVVDQQRESGDLELLSSDFDLDFRLMEIEFALDIPIAATFKEVRNMARTPYEMAKILILGGKYERSDMEYKLGKYLERKQITQAQYDELIALMEANELVV